MGFLRSAFWGLLCTSLAGIGLVGCGTRGALDGSVWNPCEPGEVTCLSEQVGQICNAQGQWATFQCADKLKCSNGTCIPDGLQCNEGDRECVTTSIGQLCNRDRIWATFTCALGQSCSDGDCRDNCVPQTHECASASLLRICRNDGSGWETNECPEDTSCQDGVCVGECVSGTTTCVNDHTLWQCNLDAGGYVERECPPSMSCSNGRCAPNAAAGCSFGENDVCLGETTALVCLRDGSGYEVKDCPSETRCLSGKCWGPVCVAGATSCLASSTADFTGVQTCNADGSGYTATICEAAGKCVQDKYTGQYGCYVPPCTSGTEVCGDPTTEEESTNVLSRCETLVDGKLGWVTYHCDSPSSCEATSLTAAACHSTCSPGALRCSTDGTATEVCGGDGTWVATACEKTASVQDMCVLVPTTMQPVCGDDDCRTLATSLTSYTTRGRCLSNLISTCGDDGRLTTAIDCEEGQCVTATDGFGTCKDPTRCNHEDGWRECIASNDSFRTCQSGHWEFTLCNEGELCTNMGDGAATCGNDCIPDKTRCVDADYQVCSSDGTWGKTEHCSAGECNPLTSRCETACVPGQLRCTGDVAVASDTTSLGSRTVERCTTSRAWSAAETCSSSTLCRRSGMGEHLGCVQCVGPEVIGGNEEGAVDSRCSTDTTGYQTCQADNTWPAADTACAETEHCAKQRDGSITGTCSNYGCTASSTRSTRCIGYETVTDPVTIDDCCAGDCDSTAGKCLHRKSHYDSTCVDTASCSTGRYDTNGASITETCCSGYCKSGQGCLKIKAPACSEVTSCSISKVDHNNICCGTCLSTGLCTEGMEAQHPVGEYFACGSSTSMCWRVGSCSWQASGSTSGAMFANCVE